jgi:N-methylhydantoinase A
MHACAIARNLGIPEIIVPVSPGAFSAFGMLVSDVRHDFVRTFVTRMEGASYLNALEEIFSAMRAEATATLTAEGVAQRDMVFERSLDLRYVGQEYTVSVSMGSDLVDETAMISIRHRFHRLHERQYGHSSPSEPLELVDLRIAAHGVIPKLIRKQLTAGGASLPVSAILGETDAVFGEQGGTLRTPLINREALLAGNAFEGPAIVVERTATTVIEPGFQAVVLVTGEILLTREE